MNKNAEVICSTDCYRIIRTNNKYVVEANKTFMNVWYPIKTYSFFKDNEEEFAKKCAYEYYVKSINK